MVEIVPTNRSLFTSLQEYKAQLHFVHYFILDSMHQSKNVTFTVNIVKTKSEKNKRIKQNAVMAKGM